MTDFAAIWDYDVQPKEAMPGCQTCGHDKGVYWKTYDRYGYPVRLQECIECHRFWFNPRMTSEAYAEFYASGAYRRLVSAFHGRDVMATIEDEQRAYAKRLGLLLKPWNRSEMRNLLDVGGSTGVVVKVLGQELGIKDLSIIDPAASELPTMSYLTPHGGSALKANCTIEDFDAHGRTWDLITLCQTADHLLDLMGSLRKIKTLLSPDGLFWSDIVDFDVTREVKIDHPFNLTEKTYRQFLSKAGFSLLQINYAPDGKHIGFLAR